jgi:hypothetical protein
MTNSIKVVVYTYKGSGLQDCIESLYNNVSEESEIFVTVYDQHPLVRSSKLPDSVNYEHIFWDHMYTPINYKKKEALLNDCDYFLSISADISFNKNWDLELIEFLRTNEHSIISGQGKATLGIKDKYFLNAYRSMSSASDGFVLSGYIDRNMLFCDSDTAKRIEFPVEQKYLGEEEFISLDAFRKHIRVFSCPSGYYLDNMERTLENLYTPFSTEHLYNNFIDYINDPDEDDILVVENFFKFHGVDYKKLKKIPYQVDDVLYDPNTLKIVSIGGERYIDSVKVIY